MSTSNIEDGWYDAKAKNWRWKQASTGTWQLEIWFTLSRDGHDLGEMPGWFAVTENTIAKRVEQLMALGYAPQTGDIGQEIGADEAGNCFGGLDANVVRAVVKTETNNQGVERQKVDNIVAQSGGRGAAQAVDQGQLRAFGAQMRGAVQAAMQKARASGTAPAAAQRTAARPAQAPQPPQAPQQRPAPQPTRGPGATSTRAPVEEVPDFSSADECPF